MIEDSIRPAIHEALCKLGIGVSAGLSQPQQTQEPVPSPPDGEPPVDDGPNTTWAALTGRPITTLDVAKISEVVRRFEKASGGYAAYWLTRAMICVALEEQAPLTISYASGILRRMQEQNDWSNEELHRRAREQRGDATPAGARSPRAEKAPGREPRRKPPPAAPSPEAATANLAAEAAPPTRALPVELEQHWVLVTWRQRAGLLTVITLARAQQLIARVTDRPTWEAVLANWHTQYQERANWAHFDGLLERYEREVAAERVAHGSPDAPPIPSSVIDYHPALRDPELGRLWRGRYNEAGTNRQTKQAVLLRLLREYPLPAELQAELNIPELSTS